MQAYSILKLEVGMQPNDAPGADTEAAAPDAPLIPHMDAIARILDATGDFRVLRRLVPPPAFTGPMPTDALIGVVVDVEATSLDTAAAEVIEIAICPFVYRPDDGQIHGTLPAFQAFREPPDPIPAEITAITHIDDAMVAGHRIEAADIEAALDDVSVVFAHNASYDRPVVERFWPVFAHLPWVCTARQIPWPTTNRKLETLAYWPNFFHRGHRAADDCLAVMSLLGRRLPDGRPALLAALEAARKPSFTVFADKARFDAKDLLKARGYRWRDRGGIPPKCWWTEVPEDQLDDEIAWLREKVYLYDADPIVRRVTAYERYSARAS
jgi:DNA polymerase-3 subunit epsilon